MEKIKEQAKLAFHKINDREYRCALAEAQVSEELYEQVKKISELDGKKNITNVMSI